MNKIFKQITAPAKVTELYDDIKYLYVKGNIDLLDRPGLSFTGARNAGPEILHYAAEVASRAAQENVVVIAGGASGVDTMVHSTALQKHAFTIIVLAEGINNFFIRKTLKGVWNWEYVLVVSQFDPMAQWTVERAMQRNKLVIALGFALVVIEAKKRSSGTMNAAMEALKKGHPVYALDYKLVRQNMHNYLENNGAEMLMTSPTGFNLVLDNIFSEKLSPDYP